MEEIMDRTLLFIGIGGFIGTVGRYLITYWLSKIYPSAFPYGTLAVNVIGCFAIGAVFGLSQRFDWMTHELRLFLSIGICGGFTTFSAFAFDNIVLLQNRDYLGFAAYCLASFALSLAAALAGLILTRG